MKVHPPKYVQQGVTEGNKSLSVTTAACLLTNPPIVLTRRATNCVPNGHHEVEVRTMSAYRLQVPLQIDKPIAM